MRWSNSILRRLLELTAFVGAACAAASASAAGEPVDAAKLSNLLRQDCGSCHGLTLQGGLGKPLIAERLAPWNREQLVHIILDGVPGTPMAGWRPLLSEAEAVWIAETLKKGTLR